MNLFRHFDYAYNTISLNFRFALQRYNQVITLPRGGLKARPSNVTQYSFQVTEYNKNITLYYINTYLYYLQYCVAVCIMLPYTRSCFEPRLLHHGSGHANILATETPNHDYSGYYVRDVIGSTICTLHKLLLFTKNIHIIYIIIFLRLWYGLCNNNYIKLLESFRQKRYRNDIIIITFIPFASETIATKRRYYYVFIQFSIAFIEY